MQRATDNSKKCGETNCKPADSINCYRAGEPTIAECKKCMCYTCTKGACKPAHDWRIS